MAIGRITGPMLFGNLERQGVPLAIDGNLIYADVTGRYVGINNSNPGFDLDVPGNVRLATLTILNDTITSNTGSIKLGSTANIKITGGTQYDVLYTDGSGNLAFGNLNVISGMDGFTGNNISLGTNTYGNLSNAIVFSETTTLTDSIAQLNQLLGHITNSTGTVLHVSGNITGANIIGTNIYGNIVSPSIDAINANVLAANLAISEINANLGAYETWANITISNINSNVSEYQTYSNANAAIQAIAINSLATGANANTSAYLTTYSGNISAGNLFGNLYADTITSIHGNISLTTINSGIIVLDSHTALLLPKGTESERPSGIAGEIRFNTDSNIIEWFNGTTWSGLSNSIHDQQLSGNGVDKDFLLEFPSTVDSILVSINGTMQIPGKAYTVVGKTITFSETPLSSDSIDIRFIAVPLVDVIGNGTGGSGGNVTIIDYTPPQALGTNDSPTFVNLTLTGDVFATGFYYANGMPFVSGSTYSNANVASYLIANTPTGTYSNTNVAAYLTGNISTGNVFATGFYYANGMPFVGGGTSTYSNAGVKSYLTNFDGNIIPAANVTYSLGNETHWWTELWVDSNTIYIGGKPLSFNPTSNVVTYNNQILGGIKFTESTVAPSDPRVGDQWYDTDTDVLYEYLDTGLANAWIDITGPVGVAGPEGLQGTQGPAGHDGTSVIILGSAPTFEELPTWANLTYGEGFIVQSTGNLAVYDGTAFQDVGQIKGPKGDKGKTGDTGPQGEQGIQGIPGNDGVSATNYLNFGNLVANANLNMVTGTLSFTGYNGVVVGISSNTANIGLAGNVTLTSVTSKFAEPVITGNIPSSYTPDWNIGSIHNYTAIQNFTLNAPINMPVGASMTIVVTQDSNGSRAMTANTYYKFASNIRTLSTGANSVDMMNFVRTGANTYLTVLTKGYA